MAPLITAIAGSGAFFSTERANAGILISVAANLLGISLILWSIYKVVGSIQTRAMGGNTSLMSEK